MIRRFYLIWSRRNKEFTIKRLLKRIWHFWGIVKIFANVEFLVKKGAVVGEYTVVSKCKITGSKRNLIVGEDCSLVGVDISLHDQVVIGDHVVINPGVVILTASHDLSDPEWKHKRSAVVLHDYCWVATGAIILPGVSIGRGAVVGAGSVVRSDVPDYSIAVGNPAKIVEFKRVENLRYSPTSYVAQYEAWIS